MNSKIETETELNELAELNVFAAKAMLTEEAAQRPSVARRSYTLYVRDEDTGEMEPDNTCDLSGCDSRRGAIEEAKHYFSLLCGHYKWEVRVS